MTIIDNISSTSDSFNPLFNLFGTSSIMPLLRVFLEHRDVFHQFSLSDLSKLSNLSRPTCYKLLPVLLDIGLVKLDLVTLCGPSSSSDTLHKVYFLDVASPYYLALLGFIKGYTSMTGDTDAIK